MFYSSVVQSPLGALTLACDGRGENLVGLWLAGQKYHGASVLEASVEKDDMAVFEATKKWLKRYFAGQKPLPGELPLAPIGSAFRQRVWAILGEIPYGEVTTYGDIARKMAETMGVETMSSQAVGGAVGHNPLSIIIPCHRVVGANGSLTGYAGGLQMKVKLLELEGVEMDTVAQKIISGMGDKKRA